MPLDLAAVNALDRDGFIAAFGEVFEHAPWVAEQAFAKRPFASVAALHDTMMAAVRAAPREAQLAFLNGHPELAGADARAKRMTNDSISEQKGAGLDTISQAELEEFDRLNADYRKTFGFPFIVAVRGRGKSEILSVFRDRVKRDPAAEGEAALAEVGAITRMRIDRLVAA